MLVFYAKSLRDSGLVSSDCTVLSWEFFALLVDDISKVLDCMSVLGLKTLCLIWNIDF